MARQWGGRRAQAGAAIFIIFTSLAYSSPILPSTLSHKDRQNALSLLVDSVIAMLLPNPATVFGLGLLAPPVVSSACRLMVSSYAGTVTTLELDGNKLRTVATSSDCAPSPSWLALDAAGSTLYCLDEGLDRPNGTLSSYKVGADGRLSLLSKVGTPSGPVSSAFYGHGGRGIALAEYSGSSISAYLSDPASLALIQADHFQLTHPMPNPDRQDAPHPHEAIIDPTGQYLLVPDLGADLVRIFHLDRTTLRWTASTDYTAAPGSGPRHAAFVATKDKTLMYLVSELANTITGFEVTYHKNNTLRFDQIYWSSTHGAGAAIPGAGVTAAEIVVSPDSKFLVVSSRGEGSLKIPNFDPKNSTQIPSDPLFNYAIDHASGNLTLLQTHPAGGMIPRQFSINKAGTRLAVGLQGDGRAVVVDRDPVTGHLQGFAASADIAGEVTCVVFDE